MTLREYLLTLCDEPSPVGELARDLACEILDKKLPADATSYQALRAYLWQAGAVPACLFALDAAQRRYCVAWPHALAAA